MKIIASITGKSFSNHFLFNWTTFLMDSIKNGVEINLSLGYSPNIYLARNMSFGGNIKFGKFQKPFQGVDYDYVLIIDSDIIFSFGNLKQLLSREKDIISALYRKDLSSYAVVEWMNYNDIKERGEFTYLTPKEISGRQEPFPVSFSGLGFCLIKKCVLDAMEYPWFTPDYLELDEIRDIMTEDVAFCLRAKKLGFQTFVDPLVEVGHQKLLVL
jgi:hypothetical protein